MTRRPDGPEVVECTHGRSCGLVPDGHGWDCPLSDPVGDVLLRLADPHPNPIVDRLRARWLEDMLKGQEGRT